MKENGLWTPQGFESRDEIDRKLRQNVLFDQSTRFLQEAQRLKRDYDIGVKEAAWFPEVLYPGQPLVLLLATDLHYGSIGTDYDLLKLHLRIVEDNPNYALVTNGDHIDNFNITGKWATGVFENPLPPQQQTAAFIERLKNLDRMNKLGVMSFGNHDNFADISGYDWFNTWVRDLQAPVFTSGGLLHIVYGRNVYKLAMTHKYWGNSKLNATNVCKRFMEHEYPDADIAFIGHVHTSEALTFERGGKERIAVVGGTYKTDDSWARKNGMGGRSGTPGVCVMLFPDKKRMLLYKHIEDTLRL